MVKKKLQQVTNINNYGINNGIIAKNVIIPENSDYPISNNFTIEQIKDTLILQKLNPYYIFEIKPKNGVWHQPTVGWPKEDKNILTTESKISHTLTKSTGVFGGSSIETYLVNNDTTLFIFSYSNEPVTKNHSIYFFCKKLPNTLIFGDRIDPQKMYTVYLNK